jgi:hypothetical protein
MKKVMTDALGRPYLRDWVCKCGCEYTVQVELCDETPNLSGEATAFCPRCRKKPSHGSRAYRLIDGDRYEEGASFRARHRGHATRRCAYLCWEVGDKVNYTGVCGRSLGKSIGTMASTRFELIFERLGPCGSPRSSASANAPSAASSVASAGS